jgi:hypothetical protein
MERHSAAPATGCAPEGSAAGPWTGLPDAGDHAAEPECSPIEGALGTDIDRWIGDIDADLARLLEEYEPEGQPTSSGAGDAPDLDPAALAAMCGLNGLGGDAVRALFGQDQAADVLPPGPVLCALTEGAVSELAALSDDQLAGALSAARRLESRAAYLQAVAIAEFARRREVEREEAKSRKVPLHCRPGQFPGEELAAELVSSARYADERIWQATDLVTRLPLTLAGMATGAIDATRAYIIWTYTWSLSTPDAARADEVLAAAAPGLRPDQLGRKAAALEMKLDPAAVKRRREHARQDGQRVEVRHERSGNAVIAGRELDPVTVLAAKANIDALAAKLRDANREGSLQHLRALVMTELLQGRDPLNQLTAPPDREATSPGPESLASSVPGAPDGDSGGPADPTDAPVAPRGWRDDLGYRDEDHGPDDCGFTGAGSLAPLPALINILIPASTMLGWSAAPAQVGNGSLLDADETKAFVRAASLSPRTRCCVTLIAPDGTALAHGCSRGQHPWLPPPPISAQAQGPPGKADQLADLIRRLNVTFRPISQGTCGHTDAEDHYVPSRGLKHLIRARTATCTAPACNAQAVYCDLDHTVPYPDGPTCQCNLAPKCRRHHRCKQAAGWTVEQPAPGVLRWAVPSGRSYTTMPTVYDL